MLLGVDFGTTRTVVAAVDRGNYPVVSFHNEGGDTFEWYPSLIAARGHEVVFGFDAQARQGEPEWEVMRSFKRRLALLGPDERLRLGSQETTAFELLTIFLSQLRLDLLVRSNLRVKSREKLEAMVSVPANSNSNQRFMTLEAFRSAGFVVRGMINEPSAAGIEYAHHLAASGQAAKREYLVVYDLGGGTFDSSVISLVDRQHEVLSSEGIAKLGGDNFDIILLDLAMRQAGINELSDAALAPLLEECRHKKESLHPNTRRITIDLGQGIEGAGEVTFGVNDFYEECRPLVESTIEAMEVVLEKSATEAGFDLHAAAAVYLVGGSSDLPLVSRLLREKYGRQVRRSPYPHAATAIGLAIAADADAGYKLRERFTRNFGVWREWDGGQSVAFDVLFAKDTPLPAKGELPLTVARNYHPAHNVGRYRYLECGSLDPHGHPQGDLTPWSEIHFAFDPALQAGNHLERVPVERTAPSAGLVEERYTCDASGIVEVQISDLATGHSRSFRLRGKK